MGRGGGRGRGNGFPHNQNYGNNPPKEVCARCGKSNHSAATYWANISKNQFAQIQCDLNPLAQTFDYPNSSGIQSTTGGLDRRQ